MEFREIRQASQLGKDCTRPLFQFRSLIEHEVNLDFLRRPSREWQDLLNAIYEARKGGIVLPLKRPAANRSLVVLERKRRPKSDRTGAWRSGTRLECVDQSGEQPDFAIAVPTFVIAPGTLVFAHMQFGNSMRDKD